MPGGEKKVWEEMLLSAGFLNQTKENIKTSSTVKE
jgi:hypothetical protein